MQHNPARDGACSSFTLAVSAVNLAVKTVTKLDNLTGETVEFNWESFVNLAVSEG